MIYKQVFIKSEADLPKKGNYWMSCHMGMFWYEEEDLQTLNWEEFDYYLQPCEIEMPTDEELLRQAHKDYPYSDVEWNTTTMKRDIWMECAKWMKSEIIKRNK